MKTETDAEVLRSRDARDIEWWFRFGGSAVGGLQACDPRRGEAETLREKRPREAPITKVCRACMAPCDVAEECCPYCRGKRFSRLRVPDGDYMAVHASRRSPSSGVTEKRDGQIAAAPRERRIRDGLTRVSREGFRTLRLWAISKQHGPEIRSALGQVADLAMGLSRCRAAYERYVEGDGEHSLEVWLVGLCREANKHAGLLSKIRAEGEALAAQAVREYRLVRERPTEFELRGEERPASGLAARSKASARKRTRRNDGGMPFIPGGE